MTLDGYRLMIPGPIQLAPEVLAEMSRPIVPHYGADWTRFYNETLSLLQGIFRTEGDVFPIPGSGSAGLEAGLRLLLGSDRHLLVLANGFFGERVAAIAASIGEHTTVERFPMDAPIRKRDLEAALERAPDATSVAVVHSESSSGLLNPIRELADGCRQRDLLLFVDAVSSLGGIELAMDDWAIDICVSAPQKCLEGPPGLGLVAVAKRAWERVSPDAPRSWYLGLDVWKDYAEKWADWHPFPITMAVPVFRALRVALDRVLEEGLAPRIARHKASAAFARGAFSDLGFEPVFGEEEASPTILAIRGRADLAADEVVDRLRREHKTLVARGMGEFTGKVFRVGNMGPQATREQLQPLLAAVGSFVSEKSGEKAR